MTDVFNGFGPGSSGFGPTPQPSLANLDEFEDLIAQMVIQPGFLRQLSPELLRQYRSYTTNDRDRYLTLLALWQASPTNYRQDGLTRYNATYGEIGVIPTVNQIRTTISGDEVFSGTGKLRIGVNPSVKPLAQAEQLQATLDAQVSERPGGDDSEVSVDPRNSQSPFSIFAPPEPIIPDREAAIAAAQEQALAELRAEEARELAEIDASIASLRQSRELALRENRFSQAVQGIAGPLNDVTGNVNSGFRQAAAGVSATSNGFNLAQQQIAFEDSLRAFTNQRQNIVQQYIDLAEQITAGPSPITADGEITGLPDPVDDLQVIPSLAANQ